MQNCYSKSGRQKVKGSGQAVVAVGQSRVDEDDSQSQDDRLTTKHLHTLQFLQEIANENKELKTQIEEYEERLSKCEDLHSFAEKSQERIQHIQEQYMSRADEINSILSDKHQVEIMKKVEEHVEAEKSWCEEKRLLTMEIDELKRKNQQLLLSSDADKEHKGQVELLQLKIASLEQEIERITQDNTCTVAQNTCQQAEIQRLVNVDSLNQRLSQEVGELEQKRRELEYRLSRAETQNSQNSGQQGDILASLQSKLTKILTDKTGMEVQVKEKLRRLEMMDTDNANLRKALADSERMREELRVEVEGLKQELSMLRHQINTTNRDKQTFKDFVQLKRDYANLNAENEELKTRLKSRASGGSLPALKDPQIIAVKSPVGKIVSRRGSKDSLNQTSSHK